MCCNTYLIEFDVNKKRFGRRIPMELRFRLTRSDTNYPIYYIEVPCGCCLNCKVDRRNWLEDAINYELKKNYNSCSFTCLTYDDYRINDYIIYDEQIDGTKVPLVNKAGKFAYTLNKKDFVDCIKRLRSYIAYHNLEEKYGKDVCDSKFKVVYCTEYGGRYERPHAHFLFLGISPKVLDIILPKVWKNGIIDNGELENGGIRYVLDYCEKQVRGKKARYEAYEKYGMEAPSLIYSKGLGKGLILDNLSFIKTHNLEYPCGAAGKTRPIPYYYKQKIFQKSFTFNKSLKHINYLRSQLCMDKIKSIKEFNNFRHELALKREKHLIEGLRRKGNPAEDYMLFENTYGCA